MSVLSEHIDQMWGVNHVGGLWYRTEMTSAVPAGKTVIGRMMYNMKLVRILFVIIFISR